MKRRLVLLGPPAAGKGTQAELLADRCGIPSVSPGAILRELQALGGPEAEAIRSQIGKGGLMPDAVVLRLIEEWIGEKTAYVFDGFPRTVGQAAGLDHLLGTRGAMVDVAFWLDVPEEVVRQRVADRRTCSACKRIFSMGLHDGIEADCPVCHSPLVTRDDDRPEALNYRLEQYALKTAPVIDFYRERGTLCTIDASGFPETVFRQIEEAIR